MITQPLSTVETVFEPTTLPRNRWRRQPLPPTFARCRPEEVVPMTKRDDDQVSF
jgi:hypothetical protein